jgi:hypothetical protein
MKKEFIVFILFVFMICSCDIIDDGYFNFDQDKFDLEKSKWESKSIKNYTYIQEFGSDAYPNGKVRITVSENAEPVIENLDEWALENIEEEYRQDQAFYLDTTISNMYIKIGETVNEARKYYESGKCKAIDFKIIYNKEYHYPETVNYIVWYTKENAVAGGPGYTLKITEFTSNE